ncbi:MAG: hypothetical protein ACRDOL_17845 [Streptosporangiaceae bacterium]
MHWLQYMNATLVAEIGSAEEFAVVSREWLAGTLAEVFPSLYEGLRTRPSDMLPTAGQGGPWGEPGHVVGMLDIGRDDPVVGKRRTFYSEKAWDRFLARLAEHPFSASVTIVPLDDQGRRLHSGFAYVRVVRNELYPEWTTFEFSAPAADTGWPGSAQTQDSWAGFVRSQAARAGACAGSMTDDIATGMFALERATASWTWIRDSCQVLRGYSWVTVVAAELAERLGGAEKLRASGAFYEVGELGSSLWLRATPAINDFNGERVRRVFDALAPVLLPGVAQFENNESFRIVEGVDAADYR